MIAFYLGLRAGIFEERVLRQYLAKDSRAQADIGTKALNDLTMDAIKIRLARHRRSASGTKPELIARLLVGEPWWQAV